MRPNALFTRERGKPPVPDVGCRERIAQALWDLVDPTPAKVRTILNDLGYVDERIHDLKQSGATTRFFLDLRDKGGRLCLAGSAAGEGTVVDKCVAPVSGPFTSGKRNQ